MIYCLLSFCFFQDGEDGLELLILGVLQQIENCTLKCAYYSSLLLHSPEGNFSFP